MTSGIQNRGLPLLWLNVWRCKENSFFITRGRREGRKCRNLRQVVYGKLKQLDRPPSKIQSKSFWNRLLIDFFYPNLGVPSIIATIAIRIWTIYIESSSILYQKSLILLKIGQIWSKTGLKSTIFDKIRPFLIKFEDFWLNNWHLIDLNWLKNWIYIEKDQF